MKKTTYCFKAAALAILLICSYSTYSQDVPGAAIWSGGNTPELRNWDGTSFGSNSNTGVSNGDRWRIMQGAACPTRDEKIAVGIESGGAVSGQLWNGSNWNAISIGGSTNFGSPGATYFWGLETAYESQSGDAMVVYGDGTNLRYSIWNGSTWSSETNITTCTSGTPYQMRLAANPNTDEMVLVVNFTNETECALVWNGSSWGNSVTLDTSTTQVRTDIFVTYEEQSGNAMVVYEADTDVNAKYRIWNGSAWSTEATITAPSGPSGYARWMHLASQPGSNQIALGVLTQNSDVYFAIWDGSSWGNALSATTSANGNIEPNVSVAIESLTGHVLGTYGEGSSTRYRTWNGSTWSSELTTPSIGGNSNSMELYSSPLSDQIILMVNDDNSHINTITWSGTSWGAVTELETASGETKNQPFVFIYDQTAQSLPDSQATTPCDFIASKDTYIKLKNPDTSFNFGACETLIIDREDGDLHRILLQFDLSGISSSAIITSAELRLYTEAGDNMNVSVFQIEADDAWDEGSSCGTNGSANWTNRTASSTWGTVGVVGPSGGGTPVATINGSGNGIHSWNITSLVQGWIDGAITNNGVMVGSQDGGGDRTIDYYSRETTSGTPPTLRITYGVSSLLYALRGDNTNDFWAYDISGDSWSSLANTPQPIKIASGVAFAEGDVYAMRGDQQKDFWKYNIIGNSWSSLADFPGKSDKSSSLEYNHDGYLYGIEGGEKVLYKYNISSNAWSVTTEIPIGDKFDAGASLISDGNDIYAFQGKGTTNFFRYNVGSDTWTTMASPPGSIDSGADLGFDGTYIYALQGLTKNFYRYDIALNSWTSLASTPGNIDEDGALTYDGTYIYAFQGNNSNSFWRYDIGSNSWTTMSNALGNVAAGSDLTFNSVFDLDFDSDSDGIYDSIDIDDDNDGIKDTDECAVTDECAGAPCEDTDSDSIPDYLDLDSDNDGIPDIVEAGIGSISAGTGTIPTASFIDTNNNGMHDVFEGTTPLDSDNDGTPNYRDLDSDNDAVFDVDEAGTERYVFSVLTFENGDGDINGDGVGDGPDSEVFRENDSNGDGTIEYFGDGILDIYDYGTGANEYGNLSQGSAPLYINDTDGDGTPDYIDLESNNDATFDIAESHYADLDANNDGKIDETNDADSDGLMDSFDTDDATFGSPRDLEGKFDLFFDGRNDYVEDTNVVDGWSEATLMAWFKIDPSASGDQIIFGQNSFYIQLNSDKTISAIANGNTVSNGSAINTNQWTHVAASYSNTNSALKLFINGKEISSTTVSGALPSDSSSLSLGRQPDTDDKYFNGYIDEARVFFKALALNELQKMVYQEIEDNSGNTKGVVVPMDVSNLIAENTSIPLLWNNLKRYYRMDAYKDNVLDDRTTPSIDEGSGARIYNTKIIESQSAPLPFVTTAGGRLDVAVNDPVRGINGSDAINNESAIVKIAHNDVFVDSELKQAALLINAQDESSNPIEFSVKTDSELNVSWYLELDGKLDLEGESQLVQGDGSILDADSSGYIEKDQQGTANSFNYNYWSSSVGPIGSTGARGTANVNSNTSIAGSLLDGSSVDDGVYPKSINFQSSYAAADSGSSDPITISTYWLWKYYGTSDNYYAWQKIYQNSALLPGEGYTMKGSSGNVAISSEQNYVFRGKPYNGDFTLPLVPGNDRLIGNPYPSAMDADKFLKDNIGTTDGGNNTVGNVFNGALYFWDHFGVANTHILGDYVGGYATRNLIGGAPAIANDERINAMGVTGSKIPGRYIPVNQGFFVLTSLDEDLTGLTTVYGGDIVFENSQRAFKTETPVNSVFMRNAGSNKNEDEKNSAVSARVADETENDAETRPLIRLNFESPNGMHRQIVAGVDKNASNSFDLGYDALIPDLSFEDMFWSINYTPFVIQGVENFDSDQELPLGLIISEAGLARIFVDSLENIDPLVRLYIKDSLIEETYDITDEAFEIELQAGEYYDRFSLVFQPRLKTLDEVTLEEGILIFMNDSNTLLQINRLVDTKIESVRLFNALGQSLNSWDSNLENRNLSLEINSMSTGMYIVQLETSDGDIIKKMLFD